jgi:hypothetical protein
MRNSFADVPLPGLVRDLTHDVKRFVREEINLAKTETIENISCYGRNSAILAVGGFVAYAGLIVFLVGVGIVIGFGFEALGLDPLLANFIGLALIGVLVMGTGGLLALKGIKAFSRASLAPQKAIDAVKQLRGGGEAKGAEAPPREAPPRRSSEELRTEVLPTEDRIGDPLGEIAYRTSPARLKRKATEHVRTHKLGWGLTAIGGGVLGGFWLRRRLRWPKMRGSHAN